MNATSDLRGVLESMVSCEATEPVVESNRAVLFLTDAEHGELVAAVVLGVDGGFRGRIEGLRVALPDSNGEDGLNPLQRAYWGHEVVCLSGGAAVRALPEQLQTLFVDSKVVCIPLMAERKPVGLIVADDKFRHGALTDAGIRVLRTLGFMAGLIVDNARLQQRIEQQSADLKHTTATLKDTQARLAQSERLAAIGSLLARVSDEVRTPLTTIDGLARAVGARPVDRALVAGNAAGIVHEVEKADTLLRELLEYTHSRPPSLEPTDMNRLVQALANVHEAELSGRGVMLSLDLDPHLPAASADHNSIPRVLLHLWQNSLQSMDGLPQSSKRCLRVRTSSTPEAVTVAFADSGPGIPPESLPHIFTPFFMRNGAGLGLAVVKKIIDDHHGAIEVESKPGAGARFIVSLPRVR